MSQILVQKSLRAASILRSLPGNIGRPLAVAPTIPKQRLNKNDRPNKIPPFEKFKTDDDNDAYHSKNELGEQSNIFPDGICRDSEMDVKVVKVTRDYALCRPLDFPQLKGKIPNIEMDELERVYDASTCVSENMIYKASILQLIPPDKVVFSLRRVRRVLRDDFHPFTLVIFDLPYDLSKGQIKKFMEETGGKVLDVDLSSYYEGDLRQPSFVTFLHKVDAMAAMRKWNTTKVPVPIGTEMYEARIKCKKSHNQSYRDNLQEKFDEELKEKIQQWDWDPHERRSYIAAERELRDIIPWYVADKESKAMFDLMGFSKTDYHFSIKNNPRHAR